jgi:chromosomal replication initiator protein
MRTTFEQDSSQFPELWQAAYRILEQSIVPNHLRAWIQPLKFEGQEASPVGMTIHLSAPNDFSAKWIRDHYQDAVNAAFSQVTGAQCRVVFSTQQTPVEPSQANTSSVSVEIPASRGQEAAPVQNSAHELTPQKNSGFVSQELSLDPRYTFSTFVVGASNQFAHASAVAVSEAPARQYNPLFLYSYPGLGKTHLLHAIGNHILGKNPSSRVLYISAERFMNELIDSIQHNRMPQFRNRYRDSYDVILIDDIQFIAGKVKTEEEFFHTFNALHGSKRQIVVTSDRPPKEIEGLEERIRTRFEWGLVADISPPEIETRIAIIKAKAERDDIYVPDDVATFLASYIKSNVREIEGVLVKLQAHASLSGAEISLEMAKQQLKIAVPEEGSQFTIESIQAAVAKYFRLKISDLKSASRARPVAIPRQIAIYLIRKYTGLGFKEIGFHFGDRDHSTIHYACEKIAESIETDPQLRSDVESIQNLL